MKDQILDITNPIRYQRLNTPSSKKNNQAIQDKELTAFTTSAPEVLQK
jgi:hypothetical protein